MRDLGGAIWPTGEVNWIGQKERRFFSGRSQECRVPRQPGASARAKPYSASLRRKLTPRSGRKIKRSASLRSAEPSAALCGQFGDQQTLADIQAEFSILQSVSTAVDFLCDCQDIVLIGKVVETMGGPKPSRGIGGCIGIGSEKLRIAAGYEISVARFAVCRVIVSASDLNQATTFE